MSLAPVVVVTSLELAPETSTNPLRSEHRLTTYGSDQRGKPVAGVRADRTR